ncbi:hypothetical protein L3Q82_000673 [Scortum barcoo]|uniref:Uncharacterized protein n=1 Tax=Scortum barcoo TaxID=214431 RepID=A0ACB8WFK7_9TELE|nr:hypothetical protein L3Q82_000673 [Scortum barcoo]
MQKREKSFGIQMLSVQPDTKPKGCAGCNRKIKDRYLLKALDKYWHEDCLKCACCDCRLGEVGSTLYTKANLILCRRDYLRFDMKDKMKGGNGEGMRLVKVFLYGLCGHCFCSTGPMPRLEYTAGCSTTTYLAATSLLQACSTELYQAVMHSECILAELRLFGVTGNCAACSKLIPAFEMVMRAKENVYHLDCFACQLCNQSRQYTSAFKGYQLKLTGMYDTLSNHVSRFCVGDKFFLKNNMILCQTDYEEGLMKEGYAAQVR